MKRLIVHGDAGIRKGAVVEHDGDQQVCFQVNRNGDWHGPEEVQLWCVIGDESETETYIKRDFVPHFLDVETVDAEDLTVVRSKGDIGI